MAVEAARQSSARRQALERVDPRIDLLSTRRASRLIHPCPASSSSPPPCPTPTARSTSATSWSTSRPTSGCGSSACRAHEVHFVCADDAHGAPIMIAAEKAGQDAAGSSSPRSPPAASSTSTASTSRFDNWHSTDAPGEPRARAGRSTARCARTGLIDDASTIEQFFDPVKGMFLPDRYIKGECPNCGAKDQYGDTCEVCGAVYAPDRPEQPVLGADRRDAGAASSASTSSSSCPTRGASTSCKSWTHETGRLQPEVLNKVSEWFDDRRGRPRRPRRLGHQPRRALLRHRDPRRAGQVLLRLARRAGRLPRLAEELLRQGSEAGERLRRVHGRPGGRAGALHRQGHHLLPHAVLAGDAAVQRPQGARPDQRARLHHGQRREDEQEPRHRHLDPLQVPRRSA